MSDTTTNLGLVLPTYLEDADIDVINGNMEKLDTAVASKANTADLADVATSGAYADLTGIPTVDATLDANSTNAIQNAAVVTGLNDASVAGQKRGNLINATSANHVSVHSLAVGRWYIGASSVGYIDDLPTSISSGGIQITVEEMALTNRFVITLLVNNNQEVGNVYRQWCTQNSWSSWYKYAGEVVS